MTHIFRNFAPTAIKEYCPLLVYSCNGLSCKLFNNKTVKKNICLSYLLSYYISFNNMFKLQLDHFYDNYEKGAIVCDIFYANFSVNYFFLQLIKYF